MFEIGFGILTISVCAMALISVPLVRRIKHKLKELKDEREAELLRQYPELAEIVESELGPGSGFR